MTETRTHDDSPNTPDYHPLYWDTISPSSYLVLAQDPENALACFEARVEEAWGEGSKPELVDSWSICGEAKQWVSDVFDEQLQYQYEDVDYLQEVAATKSAEFFIQNQFDSGPLTRLTENAGYHIRVYESKLGRDLRGVRTKAQLTESFQKKDCIVEIALGSDEDRPPIDELDQRTWKIIEDDGEVVFFTSGAIPDDELLTSLVEDWGDGLSFKDWSDRQVFAGICFRESALTLREITEITGLSPTAIQEVSVPAGPPWQLEHPQGTGQIQITRELGLPNLDDPVDPK